MKFLTMDLIHGFQSKHEYGTKGLTGVIGFGPNKTPHLLIIRLPNSKGLIKLVVKTMLFALVISVFPSIATTIRGLSTNFLGENSEIKATISHTNQEILPFLFHDLANEGHLKMGDKVLFVANTDEEKSIYGSRVHGDNEIEIVLNSDFEKQKSIQNESFDFSFTRDFASIKNFIDRTLKIGGVATFEYTGNIHNLKEFQIPSNYKIVYLRRFGSTNIVTLLKTKNNENTNTNTNSPTKRKLLRATNEGKKEVLEKLEDVLLEPPRASSGRSKKNYLKRTRYLPDLLGDSLESYPRRIFIDVGPTGDEKWFAKHYPTRNKDFEIYKIETAAEEISGQEVPPPEVGMSGWLKRNVREEEYVVMKAEAEVVEEMARNKALALVDELFLECKYQGEKGQSRRRSGRRAYWECLALYGRLRDEGVAVHQWWG